MSGVGDRRWPSVLAWGAGILRSHGEENLVQAANLVGGAHTQQVIPLHHHGFGIWPDDRGAIFSPNR